MNERSDIWSRYAETYQTVLSRWSRYRELRDRCVQLLPVSPIVDIGCGPGLMARVLARGGRSVTGVELDDRMLEAAVRGGTEPGLAYVAGDAMALPFPDQSFAGALANNVLYTVASPEALLREAHRVLRPGGRLVVSGPVEGYDMDVLVSQIWDEFRLRADFPALRQPLTEFVECNAEIQAQHMPTPLSVGQLRDLVAASGFAPFSEQDDLYLGQCCLVAATKV